MMDLEQQLWDILRQSVKFQDLSWWIGVFLVILVTAVQNFSKKFKPWSWLAQHIGDAINKTMFDKMDNLEKRVDELKAQDQLHYTELKEKNDKQDAENELSKAKNARRRMLRFADEIRSGQYHSIEFFNDIMEDMTFYDNYCTDHPKFKNHRAVASETLIQDTFNKLSAEQKFSTNKEAQ